MAILLSLLAAISYGGSDFFGGVASRRAGVRIVAAGVTFFSFLTVMISLLVFRGEGPRWAAIGWGALSGIGNALGTLALYRGFAIGRISIVATLSAVVTAAAPVLVGFLLGEQMSAMAITGVVMAIPSIGLVSWQGRSDGAPRAGLIEGLSSGIGFAFLFIALDQAGPASGAWPLVAGQAVAVAVLAAFALRTRRIGAALRRGGVSMMVGGVLGGTATLLFLAATGQGPFAIVAVLTALYPAVTILLARLVLGESWTRLQVVGLICSAVSIALISSG